MAPKPTFSQHLDSRKGGGAVPKRTLRKRGSIKVSRGTYLRQSSKSSKSRFDWLPLHESSETSYLQQQSRVALSDSSSSCSNAMKGSSQEGSECDDVKSVISSCHGSSDRIILSSTVMSDDPEMHHHHPSSVEVSDISPRSLKASRYSDGRNSHFLASSHDLESSCDSSDHHSRSSNYGQRSLQALTRSSSKRAVRILFKKNSIKPKRRSSLTNSQVSQNLNAEKPTCSSTIKDSRFPEHVELEPGETDSQRISLVKVCRYHHCSLNGHCHDPPPPKKPFLRRKSKSSIQQMNVKERSVSGPGTKLSAGKKKGAKSSHMTSNAETSVQDTTPVENDRGAHRKIEDSNPIESVFNGSSYSERDDKESTQKIRNPFTKGEDVPEATFELKERSYGCYSKRTGEEKYNNSAFGVISSVDDRENNVTPCGGNGNFSQTPLKYSTNPDVQVSIRGDNDTDCKLIENNSSYISRKLLPCHTDESEKSYNKISSAICSHRLQDLTLVREETNSNQKPNGDLVSGISPAGDSEHKAQDPTTDSEPAFRLGVRKPQFGQGRNISMWTVIHKHMVSGLAAENGANKFQEEADMENTKKSLDVGPDISDSDMGTYNQDEENQAIEIRKLHAIKLVRQAIEKILLPEVQDQISENQSVTSDSAEDQELSAKNHQEDDPKLQIHADNSISEQETMESEAKLGNKSEKKSLSNWSNLKKWILLQRFTKELEKVRKLNLRKPRKLQLEADSGSEKISLRRQTVDEKKRAEEWMLDYALQHVVNQLAPTQKRKVSMLVKAFETVVPPQQGSNNQVEDNATFGPDARGRSSVHVEHYETNNDVEEPSNLETDDHNGVSQSDRKHEKIDDLSTVAGKQSYSMQNEICNVEMKSTASEDITQASDKAAADNARSSERENVDLLGIHEDTNLRMNSELSSGDSVPSSERIELSDVNGNTEKLLNYSTVENLDGSSFVQKAPTSKEAKRESWHEPIIAQNFPPSDFTSNYKENEAGKPLLDKQNYLSMWHSVCQHVVSSVATKVGIELLEEEPEEVEDANKFFAMETTDSRKDSPKGSHDMVKEFSRSQVLKLVKEAVQEILSPEIQDDSSDTQSVSSEIVPEKEFSEKNHNEQNARELDLPEEARSNAITSQDSKKVELLEKSNSDPPKLKNWSKLKKLILLKRSIKAMERARKIKSQPQEQQPLPSNIEPEKVDLRHRMMDERKKAEEWMLDYAVQHVVTALTPARKRRVAMLVEAFEAVVPLPEI